MTTFHLRFAALLIPCLALLAACNPNRNTEEKPTAMLDTVSLSSKNFALAYQDGNKIVATSIDTMKQISFGGATNPAISPDGNKLAYTVTDSAEHKSIWIADMENKSQLQLQVKGTDYDNAMWSADGNLVAFSVLNDKKLWKVGLIKTDNTGYVELGNAIQTNLYSPTWKTGNEIIAHDLVNLYTFDISGKLTDTQPLAGLIGKDFTIASGSRFFYTSDGKKLVFNARSAGQDEAVYILDLINNKPEQISPKGMSVPYVFVTADDRIFYSGAEKSSAAERKIYVSDWSGNIKTLVNKGTNPTGALK